MSEHFISTCKQHLSLGDYLDAVKTVVNNTFDSPMWVRAEVRAVSSKGGHYYFELAEKGDDDDIIASCRATLWRYRAGHVLSKFKRQTGTDIQAGTTLLLQGQATFHSQYGFSFNINDIDPDFALGALAQSYHAMITRLDDEGLTNLNRSLPLPFDIRHVVVISPENAAGLGDFRREADRLAKHQVCQFHYHHATFQGNHAPQEIRQAIIHAMDAFTDNHQHLPDLMVIIRGGGAVGDLAYLNNYELASLVAEQPVPVWVGIGHERDNVVLDKVAHHSFDTPSKVIHGIQNHLRHITQLAKNAITDLHRLSEHRLSLAKKDVLFEFRQIKTTAHHKISQERVLLNNLLTHTKQHTKTKLTQHKHLINEHLHTHHSLKPKLTTLAQECRHLQSVILLGDPKHTLKKGYTLVYHHQAHISSAQSLNQGDVVQLNFYDGKRPAMIL
ncbi:exodeoxyribonuclease VII large subunit [Moraxella sp. VT-16-12]|uniref:exodeoxyribonuclease VII large subunit n=1 Tax=Moraxella sp. VT-16-12 TaxID=2014877 RepID=UPI000B7FBD33|nr:exodeoxyribonuclease VII large subunit [Moraxella sp. VT-16-12]TWV81554.1 exodeoxyribonuclease VII large subunit [Moraxella sp. VT-16-12]